MTSPKRCALLLSFLSPVILTAGGCGPAQAKPVKVQGVVTLDGKPLPGASVSFVPAGEGREASGRTGADGSFRLTTFATDDGALPGEYKVIVLFQEVDDPLAGRNGKTLTDEEKFKMRMGTMTPMGKQKQAQEKKKKPPSPVPAAYGDVNRTPLKEVVPPAGKIELALRSGVR